MIRKMQVAGASASYAAPSLFSRTTFSRAPQAPRAAQAPRDRTLRGDFSAQLESHLKKQGGSALLYGGVTLGLLASAALSVYLWKQRERALNLLQTTPFERAEELISSCEHKIEDIERAIEELKQASR